MKGNKGRLIWPPASKDDLHKIWNYYARVASLDVADQLVRDIERAGERVMGNPLQWRLRMDIWPGLGGGLRSIIVHPYTVFYQLTENDVRIVRVLHERQDAATILTEERSGRS